MVGFAGHAWKELLGVRLRPLARNVEAGLPVLLKSARLWEIWGSCEASISSDELLGKSMSGFVKGVL